MFQPKKNIIAGRNPVLEALLHNAGIDKILLFQNAAGDVISQIRNTAISKQIPVQYVPNEKLNSLTNINHQGVVAFRTSVQYQDLQQVIDWINDKGETALLLMLDGVTDVRNIGAIARSAVCYNAHAVIIPDKGVGSLNEDAVKSSAGALQQLNVCRVNSLLKAVDLLHLNGVKVFSGEMNAEKKLYQVNMKEPCCIIMGGEEKGIQPFLLKASDEQFAIPMQSSFNSLNVSVAAGIILYEASKQRSNL